MNNQHDEFQAETVEEQIERLTSQPPTQSVNGQMISDLQTFYASDTKILENVWQRLETLQETRGTMQSQAGAEIPWKGHNPMNQNQYTHAKSVAVPIAIHRARWPRLVSTLAAMLVAVLLVGSTLAFLYNRNRVSPTTANATPTIPGQATSIHPTVMPLPQLDCSHVFDGGEQAVCTQGIETHLGIVTTIGGHQVALISAYADVNRIILKYVVDGPPISEAYQVNVDSLALQGHIMIYSLFTGDHYYDAQKKLNIGIASFNSPVIPSGTTALHLTATFSILTSAVKTGTISFTIPFYTAERVATPNQTVTTTYAMTLTRVVVSGSQTELDFKSGQDFQLSNVNPFLGTLTITTREKFTNLWFHTQTDPNRPGFMNGASFFVPEALLQQQGMWTFTLTFSGYLGDGNDVFQFTVPPVQ